jgi:molybdate transport system substrate-binding protein
MASLDINVDMKKLARFSIVLSLFILLVAPLPTQAEDILVAAAASLTDVLKDLGRAYQSKSKHKILLTLGPSNYLTRQIDQGAPADIFFSADQIQMDLLEKNQRLEPGTRKDILSNRLVMIAPRGAHLKLASPKDLLRPEFKRIALADPAGVPVGIYTSQYLREEGLWDKIQPKIVPVLDVRATLASVESANVDAGFVYKTDAALSDKVTIAFDVPVNKSPKITYPIAVVRDSKKKQLARDFISFLSGPSGRPIFSKYGFILLD